MPQENLETVIWDDELHVCNVPSLTRLAVYDHEELIKILRLYPYSPFYGHTYPQLNQESMSVARAKRIIVNLIMSSEQDASVLKPVTEESNESCSSSEKIRSFRAAGAAFFNSKAKLEKQQKVQPDETKLNFVMVPRGQLIRCQPEESKMSEAEIIMRDEIYMREIIKEDNNVEIKKQSQKPP